MLLRQGEPLPTVRLLTRFQESILLWKYGSIYITISTCLFSSGSSSTIKPLLSPSIQFIHYH